MKDSYEEYEASEDQPAMTFKIQDGKEFEHTFGDTTEEHELNEDQPAVGSRSKEFEHIFADTTERGCLVGRESHHSHHFIL
jgi:hypothetical protein